MNHYKQKAAGAAVLISLLIGGCAVAGGGQDDGYAAMSGEELAEHLIFEERGFKLEQLTQEGGTVKDRLIQDDLQRVCSAVDGNVSSEARSKAMAIAQAQMEYPAGGIKLGDWRKGNELARSGYGFRVGHKTDDHTSREPGGNCYACHELDPDEIAYGTLGPSLKGYGKLRGTGDAMLKYTYEVIYSPHAYFPCTHMPRFGANNFLTKEQIGDIMAYLMHPDSPVNK
ncbi:MAG: sulfur oxidation c-type cytochrome SoxX [Gammaproteobacteria bacterium]|nr:sulfur oxidation c-type cytochrome SoxX [Gammaproteobacteria bacterium]